MVFRTKKEIDFLTCPNCDLKCFGGQSLRLDAKGAIYGRYQNCRAHLLQPKQYVVYMKHLQNITNLQYHLFRIR